MAGNQRTDRDLLTREKADARLSDSWIPTSQLPMPNPRPGWSFRYIRISSYGTADSRNISKRFREGWTPVVAKDYPELEGQYGKHPDFPEGVEVSGLLLCKIPEERMIARQKYYDNLANQQLQSVNNNYMNEQDPRMPKHNESTSRTQFRKG